MTEILRFEIDQGDLLKEAALAKEAILNTKNEVKELNTLFKFGQVPVEEYTASQVRLETQLKRDQAQYRNLTKAINTNSNSLDAQRLKLSQLTRERNALDRSTAEGVKQFDRLNKEIKELNTEIGKHEQAGGDFRRNVGNYTESIKEAVGEINIAGTSVGSLTTQIAKFATPAGAAVGVLSGLVTLYAKSSTGARDLAFAQDLLSSAVVRSTDNFGKFIDRVTGGTGEGDAGIFSQLAFVATAFFDSATAAQALIDAENKRILRDLEISRRLSTGFAKENERNAENQRRIRDDAEKSTQERLKATEDIVDELTSSEQIRVTVLQSIIDKIKASTSDYENNRVIQAEVAELESEIRDIQEEVNGKLTENVTARRAILKLIKEQAEEERKLAQAEGRATSGGPDTGFSGELPPIVDLEQMAADARVRINERMAGDLAKINKAIADDAKENAADAAEFVVQQEQFKLAITSDVIGSINSLFDQQSEEYRAFATSQAFIDTYRAAAAALAPPPTGAGPLFGPALAAATIVAGLARVAQINEVEFSGGGFTGQGFGRPDKSGFRPAGIVHEGEYVTPKRVVKSREAQPHITALERIRLRGYADGGQVIAAQATQEANQADILLRAIRNLPPPELSIREFTRVNNRVTTKENITRR